MPEASRRERADYGIDAPTVVRNFIVLAATLLLLGYAIRLKPVWGSLVFGPSIPRTFIIMGFWFGLTAAVMLWGSRFGKMKLRDRILDSLNIFGTEKILDVGCGHGLMLIGAAKRLTAGKAYGIDIWDSVDQSSNSALATMKNVQAEGVADRVELQDGDARKIPFPESSFDIVVSSWVIHNMKAEADRAQAISEIVRVLKPGGRLAITDISHGPAYARQLTSAGMKDVKTSSPNFLFVIPSVTVSATKP
jgi:arsenite methyltransferase